MFTKQSVNFHSWVVFKSLFCFLFNCFDFDKRQPKRKSYSGSFNY